MKIRAKDKHPMTEEELKRVVAYLSKCIIEIDTSNPKHFKYELKKEK